MKNVTIVYGPQGCGKTTNAQLIMQTLKADCILDAGNAGISLIGQARNITKLVLHNEHVVVLVCDKRVTKLRNVLADALQITEPLREVNVTFRTFTDVMCLAASQTMPELTATQQKIINDMTSPESRVVDGAKIIDRFPGRRDRLIGGLPTYDLSKLELHVIAHQLKANHMPVFERSPMLTLPCGVKDMPLPQHNASVRGIVHGATMYAMGIAEGLLMGGKELTIVVDGDDEARALNLNYPFIKWDCGRVRVRTVAEVMMVAAEAGKSTLGMTAWVVDVKPASLNTLLELQQWESFTAVLSGPNFDTFAQERSV